VTQTLTAKKYLTDAERGEFLSLLDRHKGERDALMLTLMLYTGCRSCELLRLRPRDFHGERVSITAAKGSNDRDVWLPAAVIAQVNQYIQSAALRPDDLLFPITTRQFRRIWDQWRPNPNKGTHAIRHTVGGALYLNSKDLLAVKYVLGHKNIQNTMVYLDIEINRGLRTKMRGMLKQKFESEEE
jgi:integrase